MVKQEQHAAKLALHAEEQKLKLNIELGERVYREQVYAEHELLEEHRSTSTLHRPVLNIKKTADTALNEVQLQDNITELNQHHLNQSSMFCKQTRLTSIRQYLSLS